jgi:hypothetical protein
MLPDSPATLSQDVPRPLKATLNAEKDDERPLDGPEDECDCTSPRNGWYAYLGQASRTLTQSRERLTPDTPPLTQYLSLYTLVSESVRATIGG